MNPGGSGAVPRRLVNLLALAALIPVALGPAEADAKRRIGSVGLELGSSKQEALSSLRSAYRVMQIEGGGWVVTQRAGKQYNHLGSVQFGEDRLVTVRRNWMPGEQNDATAVVGAAIHARTSVDESAAGPCELASGEQTQPGGGVSSIEVLCGNHGVSISVVESRFGEGVTISESWIWRHRTEQR